MSPETMTLDFVASSVTIAARTFPAVGLICPPEDVAPFLVLINRRQESERGEGEELRMASG